MVKKITEQIPKRLRGSRLLAAATALALSVLTVGDIPAVYAVDGEEEISFQTGTQTVSSSEEYNDDELLMGYLDSKLMEDMGISLYNYSSLADTDYLTADEKDLYAKLAADIKKVAAGQSSSAAFTYTYTWTYAELGVESISSEEELANAINSKFSFSADKLHNCLLNDLPYDLYWYDKTEGYNSGGSMSADGSTATYNPTFSFTVGSAYRGTGGEYSVDTSKTLAASTAAANVNAIISRYSSSSDYEKLVGYKNEICDLVEYNDEAASNDYSGDEVNPWQIIWVFDNVPDTNVVCEGYSKAFKYLCDRTDFSDEIYCYTVSGEMNGGGHMWNILEIGGTPYHVDVTNCDTGTSGYPDKLFLKGVTNPSDSGFSIESISYTYDSKSIDLYGSTYLAGLSTTAYTPPAVKTVTGIAINTTSSTYKNTYTIGESFDPTGLVITVSYSDSSTDDVTYSTVNKDDFTFDPETFNSSDITTVTVTYGGKTAEITGITVNKKTPTADDFTFTAPSSTEYDGEEKPATVTAKPGVTGMGNFTVYYVNSDDTSTPTAPTDADTYTVMIKVDDSGTVYSGTGENYITASGWKFTIDPFDISKCSVTLSPTEFTYDGYEHVPTITVEHGGEKLIQFTDYSGMTNSAPEAGNYTVKIYGKGNYTGTIQKTYTIKPAEPVLDGSVTVSSGTVYNSTSVDKVTLSGTFKQVGAYSGYTIGGTLKFADTVTGFTVGTKEYDWVFTPDSSDYTTKTGKVTINVQEDKPSSIKVTTPTKTSYTAGETFDPAGLEVEVTYESGATKTVAYDTDSSKFSFENNDNLSYGTTGKQSVRVIYTENGTTVQINIEVTVSKAEPNVSAPTGLTATYGDTLSDVDITTADDGTWAWVDDSQSVGNVGTKTFRATFTPTDTDYSSVTKEVSVTVSPKEITPTAATASDKDYDKTTTATVQSVDFIGLVGSDSFTTIGTDYTAVGVFDDANAGTNKHVTVTVTLGNSELAKNYTLSTDTCAATADINKIDPVVTTPTTLTCSYKEGETPSFSNVTLPAGWTWDGSAQTLYDGNNYCNATYTPADTTNYNMLSATVTVYVVKTECTHEHTTTTYSPESAECGEPVTATVTCDDCGNVILTSTTTKQHTWGTSYTTVTEPTCTTPGMKHIVCTECGAEKPGSETVIVALGHTGGEADCTHSAVCTRCGAEYGSPLGHSWSEGYSSDKNGHWQTCTRCGETSEAEDHVSGGAATATTPETCVVCGYEIAPATGTGGGTVTPAPTLTPTPIPSPTPGHTPSSPSDGGTGSTPSSASGPSVSGSGQKGWDSVSETIESTPEGGSVTINMNGTITLPKSVLSDIAGKDIDLVLKLNNGFEWSINGKDVNTAKNINLGANMNADNIPASAIDTLSEGNPSIQFSLKYSGDFGFVASISVPVGAKYNGKTANLFYYNPKTKALEYVSCAAISGGKAELDFSHASDWAIVITDEPMYTAEDVTAGAGIYESTESVIPGAGSTAVIAVILPVIAAAAFILRKKLSK